MPSESNVNCHAEPLDGVEVDLTAFDEGLRKGKPVEGTAPGEFPSDEVDELRDCVRLLHRAWPKPVMTPNLAPLPARLGRFEIERVLGCGGFGIVYLATDPVLKRSVALKVPRLLSLADSSLRERFRREARAAAGLDHPHIVPIHETGVEGGVDYLAAAYCPGPNLAEWLKQQSVAVSPRRAASVLVCLSDAIQYSHQHGVLHRDLKPANVLLVPRETQPGREGNDELPFMPRLTDFGLARILDDSGSETRGSAMLGTPNYMAPEQTEGNPDEIGPAVDVYGLGVILYEMLAGRPPFQSESFADVLDQVRRADPIPLWRLRRDVPRDLEVICLKCLEKRPVDRYATARDLLDDLRRFLRGEPLAAQPPGWIQLAVKWCRRRPLQATLAGMAAVIAVAGPTLLIAHNRQLAALATSLTDSLRESREWQEEAESNRLSAEAAARDAEAERDAAEDARRRADLHSRDLAQLAYASSVRLADQAWRDGDLRQCRAHLETAIEQTTADWPPGLEWKFLDYQTRAAHRDLGAPLEYFSSVAFSPQGDLLAAGGVGGCIQLIDIPAGTVRAVLTTPHIVVRGVAFDKSGERLAAGGDDGSISLWDPRTGSRIASSPFQLDGLSGLTWVGEDAWIAAAVGTAGVRLWHVAAENESIVLDTQSANVTCVAASRDGSQLAVGDHDGSVRIWDAPSWDLRMRVRGGGGAKITALAFTHAGKHLAVGGNDAVVTFYRLGEGSATAPFALRHRDDIRSIAFSPRDDRLAVLQKFGTMELWTLALGQPSPTRQRRYQHGWLAHEERGSQIAFSPEGDQIVSVGRGSDWPRLWPANVRPITIVPPVDAVDGGSHFELLFTPNSKRLIVGGPQMGSWSLHPPKRSRVFGDGTSRYETIAVSSDGAWLAAGNRDAEGVDLWSLDKPFDQPEWRIPGQRADHLSFSPSGDQLAVVDWRNDRVVVIDRARGERLRTLPARQCHDAQYSPDGNCLVVDELDDVVVWDTRSWIVVQRLSGHLSTIQTLKFSGDGRWLASAGDDREIRLWQVGDWTCARTLSGHRNEVNGLEFSPDGRSLLARDADSNIIVWHVATGLETCRLWRAADGRVSQFSLSPNGAWLAVRRENGRVEVRQVRGE